MEISGSYQTGCMGITIHQLYTASTVHPKRNLRRTRTGPLSRNAAVAGRGARRENGQCAGAPTAAASPGTTHAMCATASSGCCGRVPPWREMPDRYPPGQTRHRRFQRWVRDGSLERLLRALAQDLRRRGGLDPREALMDGSFCALEPGRDPNDSEGCRRPRRMHCPARGWPHRPGPRSAGARAGRLRQDGHGGAAHHPADARAATGPLAACGGSSPARRARRPAAPSTLPHPPRLRLPRMNVAKPRVRW